MGESPEIDVFYCRGGPKLCIMIELLCNLFLLPFILKLMLKGIQQLTTQVVVYPRQNP